MMVTNIIFSATRGNNDRTQECNATLKARDFNRSVLAGRYTYENGTAETETSFNVPMGSDACYDEILELAFGEYKQESVLLLDADNNAVLLYNDGKKESIGVFTEVSQDEAWNSSAMSYDSSLDKWYICK